MVSEATVAQNEIQPRGMFLFIKLVKAASGLKQGYVIENICRPIVSQQEMTIANWFTCICTELVMFSLGISHLKVTSHERHYAPNHWQHECLFNRFLRITTKKISKLRITGPLWKKNWRISSQGASDAESSSVAWRHQKTHIFMMIRYSVFR